MPCSTFFTLDSKKTLPSFPRTDPFISLVHKLLHSINVLIKVKLLSHEEIPMRLAPVAQVSPSNSTQAEGLADVRVERQRCIAILDACPGALQLQEHLSTFCTSKAVGLPSMIASVHRVNAVAKC